MEESSSVQYIGAELEMNRQLAALLAEQKRTNALLERLTSFLQAGTSINEQRAATGLPPMSLDAASPGARQFYPGPIVEGTPSR